ncbi:MAG: ribbon-helix-helix domain-containing protein [Alphaproteobacteria bacterium]
MKKRSLIIAGHATSVALEREFWEAFDDIARHEGLSAQALIDKIDKDRTENLARENLARAIRLFILKRLRASTSSLT